MSYAKSKLSQDPESIKLPGTHLKKILVDMKSNEESNQPRYVRHRRRKSKYFQISSSESSVESCNWSSDEETLIQKTETESLSKNNVLQDVINNRGNSKKNILLAKKKLVSSKEFTDTSVDSVISGFNSHIPTWGATFSNNNKKFRVINTCTIDNFLFAFWVLSKIKINFFDLHPQNEIKEIALKIINQIDIYDWDRARQTWYVDVLKGKFKNQTISLWGELDEFFLDYMYKFQVHALQQKCNSSCKENLKILVKDSSILYLGKKKSKQVQLIHDSDPKCSQYKQPKTYDANFYLNPIYIYILPNSHFKINDLPPLIRLDNRDFALLCAIIHINRNHFVSVFYVNGKKYLVDDMSPNSAKLLEKGKKYQGNDIYAVNISSAMFYLV
jgi:hypothetical protein